MTGNLLSHYMAPYVIFGLTVVFRLRTSITFISKQIAYFMIFGIMDLRTTEPFRSDSRTFFYNLRTFELKNLRTHEPSNLRTFGLMGCNRSPVPMFPGTYVPRYRCSPNLCSPVPMFPSTYVPRFTANMLDVVICIGLPSELFDKQFRYVNGRAYSCETQTHTHTHTHTHSHAHTHTHKQSRDLLKLIYRYRFDMVGHEKEIDSRRVREGDIGHM